MQITVIISIIPKNRKSLLAMKYINPLKLNIRENIKKTPEIIQKTSLESLGPSKESSISIVLEPTVYPLH